MRPVLPMALEGAKMTVEEGLIGQPVGFVKEGLQSQPVGNNCSGARPTHARQQAGAQAGARARAVPVSFPVDGAERVTFQVPGNDLRWVAHVLDALAHRWGEASAEMPEGRVRTKKGRGGGLRKLIVVGQIEDDLRRKLDPKDRSWRVRIADAAGTTSGRRTGKRSSSVPAGSLRGLADGKYVEALPVGGRCRNASVAMRLADEAMAEADYTKADG